MNEVARVDDGSVGPRGRVLVVDDDEPLTETYATWLDDRYEVVVANSGAEALDLLDGTVDVVLLDRRMPELSGDEVLERIRERGLDCRVSMLTAVNPDSDIVEMPFDDYLVKPVTREDVLDSVERLLLYDRIDADLEDVLAMVATWEALSDRRESDLRDPDAVESLRERLETARRDERTREKLAAFERVRRATTALRDANRELTRAETREEIETGVADALAGSGAYEEVFVGDYPRDGGTLEARVRRREAGADYDEGEAVELDATDALTAALDAGELRTLSAGEAEPLFDPVTDLTVRTVAVVPLVYRDTTYGAVLAYTDAGELPERERELLSEVGERAATELHEAENRQLMFADATVELTLETSDRNDPLVELSAALDCAVSLRGFVPVDGGGTNCYIDVSGTDSEAVSERFADADGVERYRGVVAGDDPVFEVTVTEASLVHAALGASANVVAFDVESGAGTLVLEVASGGDVRRTVESIRQRFPDVSLRGKRTTESAVQTAGGFRSDVDSVLTDRQRTVLEAAYEAGYYEFPRSSDGEEVAASLSISAATFHQHLRRATGKLVGVYLDGADSLAGE